MGDEIHFLYECRKLNHLRVKYMIQRQLAICRTAKSPGISGSLQKWGVISRSPGIVKKTPGIEGIRLQNLVCGRNANFCRI